MSDNKHEAQQTVDVSTGQASSRDMSLHFGTHIQGAAPSAMRNGSIKGISTSVSQPSQDNASSHSWAHADDTSDWVTMARLRELERVVEEQVRNAFGLIAYVLV